MAVALPSVPTGALVSSSVVLLAAAVTGTILIGPYNRLSGRGAAKLPMRSMGDRPILQLELARSEDDVRAVLMVGDQGKNLHDASVGNALDSFLFIPAYAGFLFAVGLLLSRTDAQWESLLSALAVVAVPVIALCDWTENLGIANVIGHIQHTGEPRAGDAMRISVPSLVKWSLLTVTLLAYGASAVRNANAWRLPLGIMLIVAGLLLATMLVRYLPERFP
jgi:hypothetical protein